MGFEDGNDCVFVSLNMTKRDQLLLKIVGDNGISFHCGLCAWGGPN